ncbi:MAG: dihydrodipicolinate synthase family protein [Candidatus Rokubacteria bacterium]|nr:dihydrodipicolinate synthase family protein [Candidatus Rokubacteria bacterium]
MATADRIEGMVPVIPIPFRDDEAIDRDGLAALCDFAARQRVAAACLPAFGSEFYKLGGDERLEAVRIAVEAVAGRIPIVAQSNHGAARLAAELAQQNQKAGASVISVALPRAFTYTEADLLEFAVTVGRAVDVPLLVQDWNPAGPAVGAEFCARLREACPNFRYIKLEEPKMGPKVREIRSRCREAVGVLEGWGGEYMLELIPAGIVGVMPGLGMIDVLQQVWELGRAGRAREAYGPFARIHPWIAFSLQSIESYNYLEKKLLIRRGLIRASHVRKPTITLDPDSAAYADFLIERVMDAIEAVGVRAAG